MPSPKIVGRDGGRPSSMKKSAIVYWLIPANPERELFCDIIRILYKQFDAPNFDPHLTLLVAQDGEAPKKILEKIKAAPIRLGVRGVAVSDTFTKTLFVQMNPNDSLKNLVVDLDRATRSGSKTVDDPHVSLLYKELPASVKKELASTIKLPFSEVTFDSIRAVRLTLPVRNREDVESWETIATKSLSA